LGWYASLICRYALQILFLLYHYFVAKEMYNAIRVFIAAYVWMTGFGNFSYYYVRKDFSVGRFCQVSQLLNFSANHVPGALPSSFSATADPFPWSGLMTVAGVCLGLLGQVAPTMKVESSSPLLWADSCAEFAFHAEESSYSQLTASIQSKFWSPASQGTVHWFEQPTVVLMVLPVSFVAAPTA
jgi:hypothetical protein